MGSNQTLLFNFIEDNYPKKIEELTEYFWQSVKIRNGWKKITEATIENEAIYLLENLEQNRRYERRLDLLKYLE